MKGIQLCYYRRLERKKANKPIGICFDCLVCYFNGISVVLYGNDNLICLVRGSFYIIGLFRNRST